MDLKYGNIYHIYNQGNNRGLIFFNNDNYHYFLRKISEHICPYADLLCWCLMPNHFHLIIALQNKLQSQFQINNSIAVMLRSYTRAINIQENRSGALFREGTKAEYLDSIEACKLKYKDYLLKTKNHDEISEEYVHTCYKYVLNNPVRSSLVKRITDWEFSSVHEIIGERNELAINRTLIHQLGLVLVQVTKKKSAAHRI